MPDIKKLILSIDSGKYCQRQLVALYNNTNKNEKVSESEKEEVISRIVIQLRKSYPRAAKKLLGPLDTRPKEVLEEIFLQANSNFDLSKNTVKNGVKAGGGMISGDIPVDWYLSYKDSNKNGVVAGAIQSTHEEPLIYRVFRYTGASRPENRFCEIEFVGEDSEFGATYMRLLDEVVNKAA